MVKMVKCMEDLFHLTHKEKIAFDKRDVHEMKAVNVSLVLNRHSKIHVKMHGRGALASHIPMSVCSQILVLDQHKFILLLYWQSLYQWWRDVHHSVSKSQKGSFLGYSVCQHRQYNDHDSGFSSMFAGGRACQNTLVSSPPPPRISTHAYL